MIGIVLAASAGLAGELGPPLPYDLFSAAAFVTPSTSPVSADASLDPDIVAALGPVLAREEDEARVEIGAFYQDLQLDVIRKDDIRAQFGIRNSTKVGETNLEDVDRWRAGVQVGWGIEAIRVEARVFHEEFHLGHDIELLGGSIIAEGQPELGQWGEVAFLVDYRASISYARGDGDVPFVDQTTLAKFDIDGVLSYWEAEYRLGLGIEIADVQLTVGGVADVISGLVNLELDDDLEFEGGNFGGYARVAWRPADLPIYMSAVGFAGDVRGIAAEFGFRF